MDYCLGDGDGTAAMWSAEPNLDIDGDGEFDAIGLDFDGDGLLDDALADLDGDGVADHAVLDLDDDGHAEASFTDDGTGTWAVSVDAKGPRRSSCAGSGWTARRRAAVRWSTSTVTAQVDDRLLDADRDGLADRALVGDQAYVDADGDGRWDVRLADTDGDGAADAAAEL